MLNIKFKDDERTFKEMQVIFNTIAETSYPNILHKNHFEIWKQTGRQYTPELWKKFRMDPRVDEWYDEEFSLSAKNKVREMASKLGGDRKSTADVQAMSQLLGFLDKEKEKSTPTTKMVYCFIPLNDQEVNAPNVKVLESIPDPIKNALHSYQGDK
jgi:hypothetical protein